MIASATHTVRERKNAVVIAGLGTALIITTLISLSIGAVSIPVGDVLVILLQKFGLYSSYPVDDMHSVVLSSIRLPRIFMTMLIGGSLAIGGAALQGLFRNPLVEPSLIGVSGGSAAAVVILIVFGGAWSLPTEGLIHNSLLPIVAFAGGSVTTFIVLRLSY